MFLHLLYPFFLHLSILSLYPFFLHLYILSFYISLSFHSFSLFFHSFSLSFLFTSLYPFFLHLSILSFFLSHSLSLRMTCNCCIQIFTHNLLRPSLLCERNSSWSNFTRLFAYDPYFRHLLNENGKPFTILTTNGVIQHSPFSNIWKF